MPQATTREMLACIPSACDEVARDRPVAFPLQVFRSSRTSFCPCSRTPHTFFRGLALFVRFASPQTSFRRRLRSCFGARHHDRSVGARHHDAKRWFPRRMPCHNGHRRAWFCANWIVTQDLHHHHFLMAANAEANARTATALGKCRRQPPSSHRWVATGGTLHRLHRRGVLVFARLWRRGSCVRTASPGLAAARSGLATLGR